jgi:hypothetical protein
MTNEGVVERLDMLIAILRLAHREEIESARAVIRSDEVNTAILEGAADWVGAGKLGAAAAKKTKQSERTVKRRVAELLGSGLLQKKGAGTSIEYRTTGLV